MTVKQALRLATRSGRRTLPAIERYCKRKGFIDLGDFLYTKVTTPAPRTVFSQDQFNTVWVNGTQYEVKHA